MIGVVPFILAGLDKTSIVVLTVFLMLDVTTGLIAAVRMFGWNKLSSRTLSFGILFKMLILLIPLIVVWTGKGIGFDLEMFAIWSINLLIVSEAISIIGNIHTIKTGQAVKELDAVNLILKKFKKVLVNFLER